VGRKAKEKERCGGRGLRTYRRAFPAASDLERNSGGIEQLDGRLAAMLPISSVSGGDATWCDGFEPKLSRKAGCPPEVSTTEHATLAGQQENCWKTRGGQAF